MHRPRILGKFSNIKIRKKLLLSYMLVVFLPVLIVGFILNSSMRSMIVTNAMREASVNVDRTYSRLNEVMKLIMDISYKMQMDQNLENLLLTEYRSTQEVFDSYFQYMEFNNTMNLHSGEIRDIRIYSHNKSILDSGQFMKITPEVIQSDWYSKIDKADGRILWQYLPNRIVSSSSICLTRIVRTIYSYKILGALIISINGDYLNKLVSSEPYDTYFVDDLGNVFASGDKAFLGVSIQNTPLADLKDMADGTMQIDYMDRPAQAIVKNFRPSKYNGDFKIISIVPVSVIEKQTESSELLVIIIMCSSLLLAFVLILIFSNAISKRIKKLSKDMHIVAMGNFDISPGIEGDDEIGQLSRDLNIMTNSIRELVQEVYITKAQKDQLAIRQKEIKLEMLANQINPHFLFNALETIRMKAHCNGQEELAEIVKLLGRIMRKNLEIGSEMITVESEVDLVACYLEIQRFRYGERINYEIQFDSEEIKQYKILPLIIQPLVENAIVHGLESKEGKGKVSVHLCKINANLLITIEDDGEGMSPGKLEEILASLNETEDRPGKRIGLNNVHQRLKLFYGEEYGLRIISWKGRGTKIEIRMPGEGAIVC